jgi:hypothetical protein
MWEGESKVLHNPYAATRWLISKSRQCQVLVRRNENLTHSGGNRALSKDPDSREQLHKNQSWMLPL